MSNLSTVKIIGIIVLVAIINEIVCAYIRYAEGKKLYNDAKNMSSKTRKQLVVIGNPTSSWKNYIRLLNILKPVGTILMKSPILL